MSDEKGKMSSFVYIKINLYILVFGGSPLKIFLLVGGGERIFCDVTLVVILSGGFFKSTTENRVFDGPYSVFK